MSSLRLSTLGSFGSLLDLAGDDDDASSGGNGAPASRPRFVRRISGGRRPNKPDQPSLDDADSSLSKRDSVAGGASGKTWLNPPAQPSEARLTVVQITDVYTLENFASLKTMLERVRESQGPDSAVISVLTGDFLSPYLLSSIDRGRGMMKAIDATPVDYLIWGNHEADVPHDVVCDHVRRYRGKWINSNMQDHDAMDAQIPYDVVEVTSPDGTNVRRIGLVAVLSDDPKLYAHFKAPGAFGGAKIDDPWDTLERYKRHLEVEERCDVVLPLQHLYVPDDIITCERFDFPVILSGHDHHRVDSMYHGTRLIKPGMDGVYATVLEMTWSDTNQAGKAPKIRSTFVETSRFEPDPTLKEMTDRAYDVLLPLRNTELMQVPSKFEPLSSKNSRGTVTTMGRFICTLLRDALNQNENATGGGDEGEGPIDAVILMGGNIRGGESYEAGSFFSLEMLEAEIKSEEVVGIVSVPGDVLAAGIEATHEGDPKPGWMQYDDGVKQEGGGGTNRVITVGGKPLDPSRTYRVATKVSDLGGTQSPPFREYFTDRPDLLPSKHAYFNIQTELMAYFSKIIFGKLWNAMVTEFNKSPKGSASSHPNGSKHGSDPIKKKNGTQGFRFSVLDTDGDGLVSVDEIHAALKNIVGLSVHDDNRTLAEYVHARADVSGDGVVTREDLEHFCRVAPRSTSENDFV